MQVELTETEIKIIDTLLRNVATSIALERIGCTDYKRAPQLTATLSVLVGIHDTLADALPSLRDKAADEQVN